MKIRTISQIENTGKDVKFTGGNSLRLILESDNMGFAFMKTIIPKGGPHKWHYPHHLESCFCIAGSGILTNLTNGEVHNIFVDTIYILDGNEPHTFEATEDCVLISVFNPPLSGNESHDINGHYPKSNYTKSIAKKIVAELDCCKNNYDAVEIVESILNNNK
jgi:L-ectoine synthase